jgi:hypothetical protein
MFSPEHEEGKHRMKVKRIALLIVAGCLAASPIVASASPIHRSNGRYHIKQHAALISADKPVKTTVFQKQTPSDDDWYTPPKSPGFRPFIGG